MKLVPSTNPPILIHQLAKLNLHSTLQQAEDVLRECKERKLRKFQDEENRLCEEENRLCEGKKRLSEEKQRLCEEEQREYKERKFQDGDVKKFQMDQNQQRSEGWRRPWSNGMMKNKWSQERNRDGKTEVRWRQGTGNHDDWRQRDRGALGFFLCPVCLATHLVPR